jgi:hypothetical protein
MVLKWVAVTGAKENVPHRQGSVNTAFWRATPAAGIRSPSGKKAL